MQGYGAKCGSADHFVSGASGQGCGNSIEYLDESTYVYVCMDMHFLHNVYVFCVCTLCMHVCMNE